MAKGGTVNVNLVAHTAEFEKGMTRAIGALNHFAGISEHVNGLIGAFLSYEAVKHVAEWVHQTMEAVDKTSKLADTLGITTQAMQELGYSASLAGTTAEETGASMLKMEKNLSGVGSESAKVNDALAAMHLTMADLGGKSGDEQLRIIADGLKNVHSSADRTKIAVDLFGKSGANMLPMLREGSEGLRKQAEEADALGLAFSRVDGAKIEQANDAMTKVGAAMQGGLIAAAKELAPLLEGIANYFVDMVKQAGGFGSIASSAMKYVVKAIEVGADALNVLKLGWDAVKVAVTAVVIGITDLAIDTITNFLEIGTVVYNFGVALGDTGRFVSREFSLAWGYIKLGAAEACQFMGVKFAGLLDVISNGLRAYSDTLADAVMDAAGKVRVATGTMAGDSKAALAVVKQDADYASQKMRDSWSNIGDTSNVESNPLIGMLKEYRAAAQQYGESAAGDFVDAWDAVVNEDGSASFDEWYATQQQLSQQHAEQAAAERARQLEEDKAYAAAALAVDTDAANKLKKGLDQNVLEENRKFDERILNLKRYHEQALLTDAEFKLAQEQAQKEHQNRLSDITIHDEERVTKWQVMNSHEKIAFTTSMLDNLAALQHSHNKKAFAVGKAAAYASTVIHTAEAAMKAFDSLADIPYVGYALGAAAAAATVAAGAIQLGTISSTSFEGGGSPSASGISPSISAASSTS